MDHILKWALFLWLFHATVAQIPPKAVANDGEYNNLQTDGSYEFGYANKDQGESYHISQANRANVVRGRFGARDPSTGTVKETIYTAGPRGFRARGPNVHRKMDLDQRPRGPIGNKDDPYFDPNDDPSYSFGFKTSTYEKQEEANRRGDVAGRYSYVDDIGERHNVEYIAGKDTGFHVKTPFPDSNPSSTGPLFYNGPLVRGEKKQRGHSSIQRGLDGSYRFISAGPDQRRTESSDAQGNVRGSYSFLDDKGVQRTVHYIAGPGIGYRIVKNNKDPFIPSFFPVLPDYRDPDLSKPFVPSPGNYIPDVNFPSGSDKDDSSDDIFGAPGGQAASGHVKPPINNNKIPSKPPSTDNGDKNDNSLFDNDDDLFGPPNRKPFVPPRPTYRPTVSTKPDDNKPSSGGGGFLGGDDDDDDLFGGPSPSNPKPDINKPTQQSGNNNLGTDNGGDDDDDDLFGSSKPTKPTFGERPGGGNRPGFRPTVGRPESGPNNTDRPGRPGGNGFRPIGGGGRPRPTYRPTKRPTTAEPDDDLFNSNEDGNGYDYNKPSSELFPDDTFGKPTYGNSPSTSSSKPQGPIKRPGSTSTSNLPNQNTSGDDDDDIFGGNDSDYNLKPPKTTSGSENSDISSTITSGGRPGSTALIPGGELGPPIDTDDDDLFKPDKPSSGPIGPPRPTSPSSGSNSGGGFLDGDDDDTGGGYGSGNKVPPTNSFTTEINLSPAHDKDKGGTIFRNIGEELISFPPGASVRAHVQSIDLFPIGTKAPTPGEAVDQELKKHGS